uniref:Putative homeobox transcription factor sip1 n=1 Tax=Ixodes ricinus TaxID=34613 RepID=A0A6B0URS3_IXORI
MENESATPIKGFGAMSALVRFLACVCSIVDGQTGITSKHFGTLLALVGSRYMNQTGLFSEMHLQTPGTIEQLITPLLLNITVHFVHGAGQHGRMLALGLFITMGNQVAHNFMLISSDKRARTTSEADVLGGLL